MKKLNIPLKILLLSVWLFQSCSSTRGTSSTGDASEANGTSTENSTTGSVGDTTTTTGTGTSTTTGSGTSGTTTTTDNSTDTLPTTDNNTLGNTGTSGTGTVGSGTNTTGATTTGINESQFITQAASIGMKEVEVARLGQTKAKSERVRSFASMLLKDHSAANAQLRSIALSKNITLPQSHSMDASSSVNTNNSGTSNPTIRNTTGTATGTDIKMGSDKETGTDKTTGSDVTAGTDMTTGTDMTNGTDKTAGMEKTSTGNSGNVTGDMLMSSMDMNRLSTKTGAEFDKEFIQILIDDHTKAISLYEGASSNVSDSEIRGLATKTLPLLRAHLELARSISKQVNMDSNK